MAKLIALALPLVVLVSACGGGGGGGGDAPAVFSVVRPDVPFTSFAAVQPNTTPVMTGISQTFSGTQVPVVPGVGNIQTVDPLPAVDTAGTTAKITFDGSMNVIGLSIATPQSSVSFSGAEVVCDTGVCAAEKVGALAAVMDARHPVNAWNYQTFGAWATFSTSNTFVGGGFSAGAATPGPAIPTVGNATFNGLASGFIIDAGGQPYFSAAQMTAVVDWAARSIAFSTANTTLGNLNTGFVGPPDPGYSLTGTLTYSAGVNSFTGTVSAANNGTTGLVNGNATGRFYGPAAEEVGGVYGIKGTGLNAMSGAFGGRR